MSPDIFMQRFIFVAVHCLPPPFLPFRRSTPLPHNGPVGGGGVAPSSFSVISSGCDDPAGRRHADAKAKWSRSLFKRVFKSRPSFKLSRARELLYKKQEEEEEKKQTIQIKAFLQRPSKFGLCMRRREREREEERPVGPIESVEESQNWMEGRKKEREK
jgi:hypothetical protein